MTVAGTPGGGGLPPLCLRSWADVVQHVGDGNLNEARRVEHKEMPTKPSPGASLEIARDVASLTVDGGWLIYGIRDRPQLEVSDVVGVDNPESVRTRVGDIAIAQIHPPVSLDGEVLIDPDDPGRGLVVFSVPASPLAPHMAAGKFWGRGDRGRVPLSEAAVDRLYASRRAAAVDVTAELDRVASGFDPYSSSLRSGGRFMVVVRPGAVSQSTNLSEHLGNTYFPTLVREFVGFNPRQPPVFHEPQTGVGDPDGMVFTYTHDQGSQAEQEQGSVKALLHDDGTLWWVSSATEPWVAPALITIASGIEVEGVQHHQLINTDRVMEVLHSAVEFASGLAYDRLSYRGPWTVAVRLTGIAGARNHSLKAVRDNGGHPYRLSVYEEATQTSTIEMREHPAHIVGRLVNRLVRGMGVKELYLPYDDPAKIGERVRWGMH